VHSPEKHAENQQLRLESDENLVKVVTIHKSKGMEYPVVFLPFLWAARPCSPKRPLAFHRPEQPDQLCLDLGTGKEEHFRLAEQERLAEDLRLLYVAVTRARYCCFFCWGRVSKMEESALCYLLHGGPPSAEQLAVDLERLDNGGGGGGGLPVKSFPDRFFPPKPGDTINEAPLVTTPFRGRIDSRWQLTSYSGLTASHQTASTLTVFPVPQPERPDYDEATAGKMIGAGAGQEPGHDVFGFPKGAAAGTCLHAVLELISFTDPTGHDAVIEAQLARAGFAESWLPVVSGWMRAILAAKLEGQGGRFLLADLQETERVNEMAFYFPIESMRLTAFNEVLQEFSYAPLPNRHEVLEGLMVGFIDLVFCFDGRYYVADYKSNHLGDQPADYHQDNLRTAMLDHRYDLQYLIYTLALHRFLAGRIRDYDYADHFGGVQYLFLRGMHPEYEPGTGVFSARPPFALIDALDQCCAGTCG
jgi:exodeoxyribonuclease V beta subunit